MVEVVSGGDQAVSPPTRFAQVVGECWISLFEVGQALLELNLLLV
jgi:hypothetical protein